MAERKKEEDFVATMPAEDREREDDSLMARAAPAVPAAISQKLSSIENSGPLSILAYCLSSISMTVVNKYVVSGGSWNLTFLYLSLQALICVLAIEGFKKFNVVKGVAPFELERAKKWLPVSLVFVGMIYTSIKALQFLSVPVYTIFKNLTIIVIAYGESIWFGGNVSRLALVSFSLMVLSSVVAAWSDVQSAMSGQMGEDSAAAVSTLNAGYLWMALNVFCTASYVLGMRNFIKKFNFSEWSTMFYNNLLTIPILLVASLVLEDWSSANFAQNFPPESRNHILIGIVYSGVAATFISYCSAWCIRVTSSTTYSMVGALNKLPIAVSGLIFFATPVTVGSVSAIFIGFVSGVVYAWAKVKEKEAKKNALPTQEPREGTKP